MAIAEDASTPAVARSPSGSTSATIASSAFSPPAGAWLVALMVNNYLARPTSQPTLSIADSAGGVWQLVQNTPGHAANAFAQCAIFARYVDILPGSMTVTASRTGTAGTDMQLGVRVLTGAGGIGGRASLAASQTGAITTTLNTTRVGSVWYACAGESDVVTFTPVAGETTVDVWSDATNTTTVAVGKSTAAITASGAVTVGWTRSDAVAQDVVLAAVEVIPAGSGYPSRSDRAVKRARLR
jgi:hypothetical protein